MSNSQKACWPGSGVAVGGPKINLPSPQKEAKAQDEFFRGLRESRAQQSLCADEAFPALRRLVDVMRHKTGQGYKLRALLFSLWSGKPAELNEVLCLDWSLLKDFATIVLGWGYEDAETHFFYDAMIAELASAGLVEWFKAESERGQS